MKSKQDKLRIELYANGQFQGYAKHISVYNNKVESTYSKEDAKVYSTAEKAQQDASLIALITKGCLTANIG